jgi:hypothetical protein
VSGFFKNELDDKRHVRGFVRCIFVLGRETYSSINKAIQIIPPDDVRIPVTDDRRLEVSLAILGASLATLKGYSSFMSRDRGIRIETLCRQSIEQDYDLSVNSVSVLIKAVNKYQTIFERATESHINPFEEMSGIILVRLLGPNVESFYIRGTTTLEPFLHTIVGDIMTKATTQAVKYWKDR